MWQPCKDAESCETPFKFINLEKDLLALCAANKFETISMEKKMFNFGDSKKVIREGMKKTEEDFKDFIKISLNKKSEAYMELGCVRVFQDVMITCNALNKVKYMQLEMDMIIGELSAKVAGRKVPKKSSSSSKEKGVNGHNSAPVASNGIGKKETAPAPMKGVEKNNNPETKNGVDEGNTQKGQLSSSGCFKEEKCQLSSEPLDEVTIAMNDIHMVDTGHKKPVGQPKHEKCEEEEEEAAATKSDEKCRTQMILELYEICEYHNTTVNEWIKEIGEMIAKGNRLNWGNDQWKFWTKLQDFCISMLDRLLK